MTQPLSTEQRIARAASAFEEQRSACHSGLTCEMEDGVTLPTSQKPDEALHEQREWLRVTLSSIGDAIITTDVGGDVTYLNPTAQALTGWTLEDAVGKPLEIVFEIVNEETRRTVENPAAKALREGVVVRLARHTMLIAKDGREWPIDDSAAPIRQSAVPILNARGEVTGVVLVFREVTERRQQEQQLQDSLDFADNIIATIREPFLVLDKSLRIKSANRSFYRNFQVSPEETDGRFLFELGNGQWNIPRLRTVLDEVISLDHAVEDFEVEHEFPLLGRKSMLLNARRLPPNHKNPELILLAIEDVTERRRAEVVLRLSESRQRFIMDSIPQKLATTLPNGDVDYFNPQWTEFTGLSFEEIKGCGWKQFIHPDDLAAHDRAWRHSVDTGEPFGFESRFRRADGVYRWHVSRAVPMRDQAGRIIMWVGSNTDIDDIKQAEAALQGSEIRYRRLFEAAKDGILILDILTGRIIDANPYMGELLGYAHQDFLGKELWEIGLFSDKAANEAAVRELQERGYIRYEDLPLESTAGRRVDVEVVANAYREDHHNVIQCNIRDITERSRLEKQLQQQSQALADLHSRKDEFLAMLSHELRSPLAPIANAVQLLQLRQNEDRTQQRARTIIERQVIQLTRLVDDLMEVSRITSGRVQLRQELVAVSEIVERAVETSRPLMDQRRHELTVALPMHPIWLSVDATRLEQVLVNLLTNAAKYTPDRGHIGVIVEREADECVLRIRDTGVGIAPELLPHIFDLFTQAERSLDRSQGGLGIGLALVHRLVEMHRGRVDVFSTLGQGSEFVVRLPVVLTSDLSIPTNMTDANRPTGPGLRVLVVDDNMDTAESIALLLESSGHDVRMAYDGPAALEIAVEYQPQVMLLDIGLPRMDGFEVARKVREQSVLQNVMLVAMTGYGQESDRQSSRDAGFQHHLVKPADFGKLQDILATVSETAT